MTNGEINRLGERLRTGAASPGDVHELDRFRASYSESLESVVRALEQRLGRLAAARIKRTQSIIDKLQRHEGSTIRLAQMQDIAGCRFTVEDIFAQEQTIHEIVRIFDRVKVVDRREKPNHGYRAVHVIAMANNKPVEIQVRTILQHLWAQFSERVADRVDPAVKYGFGPQWALSHVVAMSELVRQTEAPELETARSLAGDPKQVSPEIREMRHLARTKREEIRMEFSRRYMEIVIQLAAIRTTREGQ
jgi:hypothetical protein